MTPTEKRRAAALELAIKSSGMDSRLVPVEDVINLAKIYDAYLSVGRFVKDAGR